VLNEVDGALNRQNVLGAFQRRGAINVGGFSVSFNPSAAAAPTSRKA
jgi:hypothetical protein